MQHTFSVSACLASQFPHENLPPTQKKKRKKKKNEQQHQQYNVKLMKSKPERFHKLWMSDKPNFEDI